MRGEEHVAEALTKESNKISRHRQPPNWFTLAGRKRLAAMADDYPSSAMLKLFGLLLSPP